MRTKLIALALALMLAVGTGGVIAAGVSSNTASEEQPPDNYTVEINDPFDKLSSDDIDEAIQTVWTNEQVQSEVENSNDIHFDIVAGTEKIQLGVAPGPDAEDQIVAKVDPDGTVTEVFDPGLTSDDTTTVKLDSSINSDDGNDVKIADPQVESVDEYDERLSANQSKTVEVDSGNVTIAE